MVFSRTYDVFLASNSDLKFATTSDFFSQLGIGTTSCYVAYETTPNQPFTSLETEKSCLTRINNVVKALRADPSKLTTQRWIVALENGICERNEAGGTVYEDNCYAAVYDLQKRHLVASGWSKLPVSFDDEPLRSHFREYHKRGLLAGETFGQHLKNLTFAPSADNWMAAVGMDRREQIFSALNTVVMEMSKTVPLEMVRFVQDWPKEGILFQDLMPILYNPVIRRMVVYRMKELVLQTGKPDVVMGPELRGCIFGPLIAEALELPFVPIRKPGKLPPPVLTATYKKEYGEDSLEIDASEHNDLRTVESSVDDTGLAEGKKVALVDDIVATGGSLVGCIDLVERCGGSVTSIVVLRDVEELREMAKKALGDHKLQCVLD